MSLGFLTFSTNGDSDSLENIEELNTNIETNEESSDEINCPLLGFRNER